MSGRERGLGRGHVVLHAVDVERRKGVWFRAQWELKRRWVKTPWMSGFVVHQRFVRESQFNWR